MLTITQPISLLIHRSIRWPTHLGRHIHQHSNDMSTTYRSTLGRYVGQYIGRVSVDMLTEMSTNISVEGCTKYTWSQLYNSCGSINNYPLYNLVFSLICFMVIMIIIIHQSNWKVTNYTKDKIESQHIHSCEKLSSRKSLPLFIMLCQCIMPNWKLLREFYFSFISGARLSS